MDNNLFIQKYKPKIFNDIILPVVLKNKFNNLIKNYKNMSNLILLGPSGVGKTCSINLFLNEIFGKNNKDNILDVNSINNRNLDTIFISITNFCKKKMSNPIKIILIDDADIIIKKIQNIICNLIEEYEETCKFIFICNESNKIIESIQSRSIIIKFSHLEEQIIINFLENICKKENINYTLEGLKEIEFISQGDIRLAINMLDIIYNGTNCINKINVNNLSYLPHKNIIQDIITDIIKNNFKNIVSNLNLLKNSGYSNNDIALILLNLLKVIKINEDIRINFIDILSRTYIILSNGNDTILQLYASISRMIKFIIDNKK